jgi:hypothetical protein
MQNHIVKKRLLAWEEEEMKNEKVRESAGFRSERQRALNAPALH